MAASDWSGSGTQADPYVIPADDLPWWEDVYPLIRGTGTGDSATSSTYFQYDFGITGNGYVRLTNVTPNTQDSEGDWGIVGSEFSAEETTNGGTANGAVTEDVDPFFTLSGSRATFRIYPTRNRDRTDKLYLSFYAPFGTAGQRNVVMAESSGLNTATNSLYNYRDASGLRDASRSTRTLPARWFDSSASASDRKLARVRIATSSERLQIRFGNINQSAGPDLKEYYRVNMRVEIKEVGRGTIKPNVSNTYVIPVLGGSSDTSDPYHWDPADTQAVADFLSALNKDTPRLEIAFNDPTTTLPITVSSGDGFIQIAWQRLSTANNWEYRVSTTSAANLATLSWIASASVAAGDRATFRGLTNGTQYWYQIRLTETDGTVYTSEIVTRTPTAARTAVTSQLRGVVPLGYEVDSELNVASRAAVTSQLRGVVPFGYEVDSELNVTSRTAVTSQLRGVVPFGYELDSELNVTSRAVVTSQLRGVVSLALDSDAELNVASRAVVTSQLRGVVPFGYELDSELNVTSRAVVTSQLRGVVSLALDSDAELSVTRSSVTSQLRGSVPFTLDADATLTVQDIVTRRMVGWTVQIEDLNGQTYRWWSGRGEKTIGGDTYEGVTYDQGAIASISPIDLSKGSPNKRVNIRMIAVGEVIRRLLQQDYGPLPITVTLIHTTDTGRTWQSIGRSFKGRLSNPFLRNGIYTVEAETYLGDADRGVPRKWSFEARRALNGDRIFESIASYATGGLITKWPP